MMDPGPVELEAVIATLSLSTNNLVDDSAWKYYAEKYNSMREQEGFPTVPSAVIWGSNEDLWFHKCVIVSQCVKKKKRNFQKVLQTVVNKLSKQKVVKKVVKKLQKIDKR
jgi:hypothetical protein